MIIFVNSPKNGSLSLREDWTQRMKGWVREEVSPLSSGQCHMASSCCTTLHTRMHVACKMCMSAIHMDMCGYHFVHTHGVSSLTSYNAQGFVCSLYKSTSLRGSPRNVPCPLRGVWDVFLGERRATTCPVAEERTKYF